MAGDHRQDRSKALVSTPVIPFDVIVLSGTPMIEALVEEARPRALGVHVARCRRDVDAALGYYGVPCATIVDLDMDASQVDDMLDPIVARWIDPLVLGVVHASSTTKLRRARSFCRDVLFKEDASPHLVEKLRTALRTGFDQQLRRAARLLDQALRRNLEGVALDTFVRWAVRQVPRNETGNARPRGRRAPSGPQWRIGKIYQAWDRPKLADVGQHLLALTDEPPPVDLMVELERAAETLRA